MTTETVKTREYSYTKKICTICNVGKVRHGCIFCSNECRLVNDKVNKSIEVNCKNCKISFLTSKKYPKEYCTVACYRSIPSKRLKNCKECNETFIADHKHIRYCSTECGNKGKIKKTKQCKSCGLIKSREEFGENTLKVGNVIRAYCRPCSLKKHQEWCNSNYFMYLMSLITRSRRSNKREVTVDIAYLRKVYESQDGKCAITGLPLILEKNSIHSISVDRIDSKLGYAQGNIQLVTKIANLMKHQLSMDQLYYYAKLILEKKEGKNVDN